MCDKAGNFSGVDIELAKMFAKFINREIEIKSMDFDGLVSGIQSKKADLAVGAISITEDRKAVVDFSPAYHKSGFVLLMLEGSPESLEAISRTEKMVGVRQGTWQEKKVKTQWAEISNLFVKSFDKLCLDEVVSKLRADEVAAFVLDADEARYISTKVPGLRLVPLDLEPLDLAFVVAKGSPHAKQLADFMEQKADDIQAVKVKYLSAAS
jgi:ABC-type amino acid transport substrate-binding protein